MRLTTDDDDRSHRSGAGAHYKISRLRRDPLLTMRENKIFNVIYIFHKMYIIYIFNGFTKGRIAYEKRLLVKNFGFRSFFLYVLRLSTAFNLNLMPLIFL